MKEQAIARLLVKKFWINREPFLRNLILKKKFLQFSHFLSFLYKNVFRENFYVLDFQTQLICERASDCLPENENGTSLSIKSSEKNRVEKKVFCQNLPKNQFFKINFLKIGSGYFLAFFTIGSAIACTFIIRALYSPCLSYKARKIDFKKSCFQTSNFPLGK